MDARLPSADDLDRVAEEEKLSPRIMHDFPPAGEPKIEPADVIVAIITMVVMGFIFFLAWSVGVGLTR